MRCSILAICLTSVLFQGYNPFWEKKPVAEWTFEELNQFLTSSPWAKSAGTRIYLATARHVREAEALLKKKRPPKDTPDDPVGSDYEDFLAESPGKYIVLAALLPRPDAMMDAAAAARVEEKTVMKIGKRKYHLAGHFPPSISDPHLRLVFPRDIRPGDRIVEFELYLPSVPESYRLIFFELKNLHFQGRLEL
ncbi:MAG: hypothetical protein ACRD44_07180 [Bryobacteraceae bacterium]